MTSYFTLETTEEKPKRKVVKKKSKGKKQAIEEKETRKVTNDVLNILKEVLRNQRTYRATEEHSAKEVASGDYSVTPDILLKENLCH